MDRFLSHYCNRIDAKGRVSIPSTFRAILAKEQFGGLYLQPALECPALDAGGKALIAEIESVLAGLPPCSDERDRLSMALYGTSEILKIDGEGRIVLSEAAKAHAGIAETVIFVGLGSKFQLWEPESFQARLEAARGRMRDVRRAGPEP